MMKEIALSLFVIAASGIYVWEQSGGPIADDVLASPLPAGAPRAGGAQRRLPTTIVAEPVLVTPPLRKGALEAWPLPFREAATPTTTTVSVTAGDPPSEPSPLPATPTIAYAPLPRPRPAYHAPSFDAKVTPVAMKRVTKGGYVDGSYVGPAANAYWGLLQVEATVQGGRLVGIRVLKYPSDRRTSIYINRQALPMLRDEVVSAQSTDVDIITGATLTSEAFIRSLGDALNKARSF